MTYVGYSPLPASHDAFAFDASGSIWNGTAYVTPPASGAADPTPYRITATADGTGNYTATLPAGWARTELRRRGSTFGGSYVVWEEVAGGGLTPEQATQLGTAAAGVSTILTAVSGVAVSVWSFPRRLVKFLKAPTP